MIAINEKSILIEFLKSPSCQSSYSILATKWHIKQETVEASQLWNCLVQLSDKELIKEIDVNPTNYFLPRDGEGVTKAIEYFLEKDGSEPLSKPEQGAVNAMIVESRNGAMDVDVFNCLRTYLFKEYDLGVIPHELMEQIQEGLKNYLFRNDFINYPNNSPYSIDFKTTKGNRLCRLGTIQEYWNIEENRLGVLDLNNIDGKLRVQHEMLSEKVKELNEAIPKSKIMATQPKTEVHNHFYEKVEKPQFNQGDKIDATQTNDTNKPQKTPFTKSIYVSICAAAAIVTIWTFAELKCNKTQKPANQQTKADTNKDGNHKTPKQ
jgi:hypothetical protein